MSLTHSKTILFAVGLLAGVTATGLAHAAHVDGMSFFDECVCLVVDLIEFPCRTLTNLRSLPERMNPTWRESN